ncbi:MAG: polyphenol oxidase family protein [Verrucomicrobiae bacterium]|nr:polyphenol oxidase family protein [Verrucomicrobiae bacterium]
MAPEPFEQFAPVLGWPVAHFFTVRVPKVDVKGEKAVVVPRLEEFHRRISGQQGVDFDRVIRCEQTHGDGSVYVDGNTLSPVPVVDGLFTDRPGVALGIHVADCAPVYVYDARTPAIALIHSGRKGTEADIVGKTLDRMMGRFGSGPSDYRVFIGPCIHACHYETDIAPMIQDQCRQRGIGQVADSGICTACHPDRYYSYRMEQGRTGRLFAVLMLKA